MGDDRPYQIELVPLPRELQPAPALPESAKIVTQDEEIYCPICGYNLSGVFSGRCPECGAFFDRAALIAAQQANAITLIPWNDPQEMPFRQRLYRTTRICLLDAERFAFAFSVRPRESKAASFFVGVVLATILIGIISALVFQFASRFSIDLYVGFDDPLELVCTLCAFVPLTIVMSTVLTAVFLWARCPHYDGQRHFRPWLSIAAYAAAHYLMAAATIPAGLITTFLVNRAGGSEFGAVAFSIWIGCAALCVLTLRAVVDWRTAQADEPRFIIFSIASIQVGAAILNMYLGYVIGSQLTRVIRLFC